ncbi:MAG: hypothetical protein LIO55_06375, partial [Oscillospiraceae bacterium]|nr:hypothetical protein [Oscillospiraceae bacterium]
MQTNIVKPEGILRLLLLINRRREAETGGGENDGSARPGTARHRKENSPCITMIQGLFVFWRRRRDSNPRTAYDRYTI